MKTKIVTFMFVLATLAGIGLTPMMIQAVEPPPSEKQEKGEQPFRGKIDAVNTSARTVTIGGRLWQVPDSSKLTKKGRPITLYDLAVGDDVEGTARKTFDGRTEVVSMQVLSAP